MSEVNRQWLLARRPVGMVEESDFELTTTPLPIPGEGQLLIRNRMLAFEPAMRGWIDDKPSYMPPVPIGEVMRGMAVGEVVESNLPGTDPGDVVTGMMGWQEFAIGDRGARKVPLGVDPALALSVLGITGITAYFGLLEIGRPKEGDTVVVSGAAGATGSVVGQIAKLKGCRVVGIAGGAEKCTWLTNKAHFDAAIDYKSEDVGGRLDELCRDGIDVFFDNIGGEILDESLARIARGARIVICGSISGYNTEKKQPGPKNYYNIVQKRARMEGFIVMDFLPRAAEAVAELTTWVAKGSIVWKADLQRGFESAPKTLLRLYSGANFGKQLLEI
ncbi:MAG: NADP-dependent oxidoreductase [Myxococcota bacterium]